MSKGQIEYFLVPFVVGIIFTLLAFGFYLAESNQKAMGYDSKDDIKHMDCNQLYDIMTVEFKPFYNPDVDEAQKWYIVKDCERSCE